MKKAKWILLIPVAAMLTACGAGEDKTNVELFQGMMDQVSGKAQDFDEKLNSGSNRVPPKGTVPVGFKPYKYKGDPDGAERNLVNPLKNDFSPELIADGKAKFDIYCSVCHNVDGSGGMDTVVGQKMLIKPPSLLTEKVKGYKDGRLFHVITEGYGTMGSYSTQIVETNDRWKVVNYIRQLQKSSK